MIDALSASGIGTPSRPNPARTPEEAARQFEEVLVKEFVRTMTKDVFSGGLGGDDTPGWVKTQGESQADTLANEVTRHLVEQGTLGIADMLLRQWSVSGNAAPESASTSLQPSPETLAIPKGIPVQAQAPLDMALPERSAALPLSPRPDRP